MPSRKRSAVETLFGSTVRARVLGLLANASQPMTGYRISKLLGMIPAKVYGSLRNLESTGLVRAVPGRPGSKRFVLADEDLRRFLLRRVRIATSEDWFAAGRVRERDEAIERARGLEVPSPSGRPRPKDLPNYREFIRAREKDLAVQKVIARKPREARGSP